MNEVIGWAKQTFAAGNIGLTVVILAIGAVLLFWRPRLGRRWIAAAALGYWFVSTPLGSGLLVTPLARGYSALDDPVEARSAGAIVILSGGIRDMRSRGHALAYPFDATTLRMLEGMRVFRLLEGRPFVVASGGVLPGNTVSEASVIADSLSRLGVPADRILIEDRSLNTREQAFYVTDMLRSRDVRRLVLVTSPAHMRRSVAVFRAHGADVVPSIAAFVEEGRPRRRFFMPNEDSLRISDSAVYEYAGLVYYWARGWLRPASSDIDR